MKENESGPVLPLQDLKDPVVFVIDMVNGFARAGALADPAIAEVAPSIATLIEAVRGPAVFVTDEHAPDAAEFAAWPAHCLKGTEESEIIDSLKPYAAVRIPKNSTNAFFAPAFQEFLKEKGDRYEDWILTGCCTDLCVLQLALSLRAWANEHGIRMRVIVPENCVATYQANGVHEAAEWNAMALANMKANGIQVVSKIADTAKQAA